MRQNFLDKLQLESNLGIWERGFENLESSILKGEVISVTKAKRGLFDYRLKKIILLYNIGIDLSNILPIFKEAAVLLNESWDGYWKYGYKDRVLYQYISSAYDQILTMLALGVLLKIEDHYMELLKNFINKDEVKDILFEFFLSKSRPVDYVESYEKVFFIPQDYKKIREAIFNEQNSLILIKDYLEKSWYKNHKDSGWYDSHKLGTGKGYYGYWSFESAAVVAILNLDDSSFRDNVYYPKDLVDYYRSNSQH